LLRTDKIGQGRRSRRSLAADLAGFGHRARHQGRELGADRRLSRAAWPRAAVRSYYAASAAYNPLLEVRRGEWEVRDVQNVADVLVDPEGSLERRNHWEKTSHSLLVGAILHVLYAEADKTLAGVAAFLSDPKRPIETTLKAMMATPHLGNARPHPVVASTARELLNKSDNERSGVLSTAMSFLGLYRHPVVSEVTRRCDWRITDLIANNRPATLYLVVPPSDISRTKALIRLVLNQIGRRLTEDLHAKNRRNRVLLMLDEFPALGRLDFFESALAFMAGYGLKSFHHHRHRPYAGVRRYVGRISQTHPDRVRSLDRLRRLELLPVVLLFRRRGADLTDGEARDEPVQGYVAPVHRALTEPILLGGAPRAVAILNGALAAALGLGLRLWIAGLMLWVIGHATAVRAAKRDPMFVDVVRRHLRIPGHLSV
jgi:type IV secretory pathway TrbD component